jgi:hypothetical protein
VPLAWKLADSSTAGSTSPDPVTVDCTIPRSAVTISFAVRAELVGEPIWPIPSTVATTPTAASSIRYQAGRRRSTRGCGRSARGDRRRSRRHFVAVIADDYLECR